MFLPVLELQLSLDELFLSGRERFCCLGSLALHACSVLCDVVDVRYVNTSQVPHGYSNQQVSLSFIVKSFKLIDIIRITSFSNFIYFFLDYRKAIFVVVICIFLILILIRFPFSSLKTFIKKQHVLHK